MILLVRRIFCGEMIVPDLHISCRSGHLSASLVTCLSPLCSRSVDSQDEVQRLRTISHSNLVSIIDMCVQSSSNDDLTIHLIVENLGCGSLRTLLKTVNILPFSVWLSSVIQTLVDLVYLRMWYRLSQAN